MSSFVIYVFNVIFIQLINVKIQITLMSNILVFSTELNMKQCLFPQCLLVYGLVLVFILPWL